jgi:hypothetical protein
MTLQEEKIQDDRIRGTPEIGRRGLPVPLADRLTVLVIEPRHFG